MQITYLSKASWFKIATKDKIIHIDPGYTGYFETQKIPIKQLEDKADIVLVSHFHKDHLQPKALSMISTNKTAVFAPKLCQERIDNKMTVVKPNEELEFDHMKIKTIDAYNIPQGHSTRKVHHKGDFVGYLVSVDGKTIYHAGDTDLIPELKELGNVDIALLPIGGTFVMNIDEAVRAALTINPKIVIPMHMAKASPDEFKTKVKAKSNINVVILKVGDTFNIN